ncbi:MAG: hypothetical protein WAS05_08110 [Candidatus Nanopelagicales bacterium]
MSLLADQRSCSVVPASFIKKTVVAASSLALAAGLVTAAQVGSARAAGTTCTPDVGYDHCLQFEFTDSSDSWAVPTGVTSARVTATGGGGAFFSTVLDIPPVLARVALLIQVRLPTQPERTVELVEMVSALREKMTETAS